MFDDQRIAESVEESMDANLADAWQIGTNGKPVGYDRRYPNVGLCKRIKVRLIRLLLPVLRGQL